MDKGKIIEILKKNIITKSLVSNENLLDFLLECTKTGDFNIEKDISEIIEVSELITLLEKLEKIQEEAYKKFEIEKVIEELKKELADEEIVDDLSVFLDSLINDNLDEETVLNDGVEIAKDEEKVNDEKVLPPDFVPYVKKKDNAENTSKEDIAKNFKDEAKKVFNNVEEKKIEETPKIDIAKFAEEMKKAWKDFLKYEEKMKNQTNTANPENQVPENKPQQNKQPQPNQPQNNNNNNSNKNVKVPLSKEEIEEVKAMFDGIKREGDINFEFDWSPKGLEKIPKSEMKKALRVLKYDLVRVNERLNKNGLVEILNFNLCSKTPTARFLEGKDEDSYKKYTTYLKNDISILCSARDANKPEERETLCTSSICVIKLAGYIWYLQHSAQEKLRAQEMNLNKKELVKENIFPKFVGMEYEKEFILNIGRMIEDENNKEIYENESSNLKTMMFIGNQGLGQEEFAERMVDVLYAEGYLKYGNFQKVHGATMGTTRNVVAVLDGAKENERVIFIEEADRIYNDSSLAEIYTYINNNKDAVVILSVTPGTEKRFLNRIKALKTKIAYTLKFEDYTEEELYIVFENKIAKMKKTITEDAAEEVKKIIRKAKIEENFGNIRYIENLIQRIMIKQSIVKPEDINVFTFECIPTLEEINFQKQLERDPNIIDKVFEDVYGLKNLIKDFKETSEYIKYRKEIESKQARELPKMNMHMAFLGNSGTGKTMMAEKLAKILYNLGCIRENKFIEVTRKDLVADRLGETAQKTMSVIESAIGGVLLIDEAYTLGNGSNLDKECIATILHALDKYREDVIVIFAGYTKDMEQFFNKNQGLRSRIGYFFDFPDYSTDELYKIFEIKIKYYGYTVSKEAEDYVRKILKSAGNKKNVGNARFVENLIQKIFIKKSNNKNQSKKKERELQKEDIPEIDEILNLALGNRNEDSIDTLFDDVYGMEIVKNQIISLGKYAAYRKKVLNIEGKGIPECNMNMVFQGNPGTGKTMIARKVAQLLFDLNVIRTNRVFEVSRKDLVAEYLGQTAPKTAEVVESALGGVLFIDEAYSLCTDNRDPFGKEAIAELIKMMEDNKDDLIVIFAGYTDEMQIFLDTNSGIRSRIGYTIEFPDYSVEELYKIFELKMHKNGFEIEEGTEDRVKQLLKSGKESRKFGNGRFVDKVIQRILINKAKTSPTEKELCVITKELIPNNEEMQTQTSGEERKDIDELLKDIIGLEKVKKQIHTFMKYVEFKKMLPPESYNNAIDLNLHMLFIGDAGTGKTTLANRMAEILYNAGILRINKVVVTERKDLVGQYIGETAQKTQKKIEEAMGGILFVDEAYSLSNKTYGGHKDFGHEAIETILTAMVTHRNDLIVIFAGYKKEMDEFINSNSGLMSRIGYTFEFENYTDEQLYEIFQVKCNKYNFKINENIKQKIMDIFKYFSSVDNFGNGRFVEKVLQEIIMRHAQNPNLKEHLLDLMEDDIPDIKEVADVVYSDRNNLTLPTDITEKDKKNIAIHELGHAIVHYLLNDEIDIKVITVVPEATGNLGYVLHERTKPMVSKYKKDYLNRIKVLLAGRAAEEVFIGDVSTGCSSDLQKSNWEVTDMIKRVGLSDSMSLVTIEKDDLSDATRKLIDDEKKKILDECYKDTKDLINKNTNLFYKCLDYLIEKGTISGEELLCLLENKSIKKEEKAKKETKKKK